MSDSKIDEWLNKIRQRLRSESNIWTATGETKTIWHYTSFLKLTKIIPEASERFIRATPLTEMNDHQDGRWLGTNVAKKLTDPNETYLRAALQNEPLEVFATCFSGNCDKLSQWWRYADQGRGVALGFNVDKLHTRAKTIPDTSAKFYRVKYIKSCNPVFEELASDLRNLRQEVFDLPDVQSGTMRGFYPAMKKMLPEFEPGVKNKAFEEEDEYRIIFHSPKLSGYEPGRDRIVPYLNIPIKDSITHIILGPLCKAREANFQDFIKGRLGYSIELSRSSATLRA